MARDIIPSGQYGAVPPPVGATTQAMMYNAITPLFNHVSDAQLPRFFKPATLSTATPGPVLAEMVPRSGVSIVRDGYDVPHIHGVTRDDVTWGAGWVIAEDRGLLLNEARYDSLVAAIDPRASTPSGWSPACRASSRARRPKLRWPSRRAHCLRQSEGTRSPA